MSRLSTVSGHPSVLSGREILQGSTARCPHTIYFRCFCWWFFSRFPPPPPQACFLCCCALLWTYVCYSKGQVQCLSSVVWFAQARAETQLRSSAVGTCAPQKCWQSPSCKDTSGDSVGFWTGNEHPGYQHKAQHFQNSSPEFWWSSRVLRMITECLWLPIFM